MRGKRADERPAESIPEASEPLQNPRWEHFARSVAGGATALEAYKLAGYSESGAGPSSARLLRNAPIRARVEHLSRKVEQKTVEGFALTREWVLGKLKLVAMRCLRKDDFQPSGANRALELLGKELGMFRDQSDHTFKWDGDITKLDANQQAKLMQALETIAFRGDAEAKARAEAEVLREIDAPAAGAVQ